MHKCRKYTLVELITVMAIAALLFAIGVPAFSKMTVGRGVDQTASLFKSMTAQAQAQAAALRKDVALVIDVTGKFSDGMQSVRLCVVEKDNGSYKFKSWVPDSRWRRFENGAFISACGNALTVKMLKRGSDVPEKFSSRLPGISGVKVEGGTSEFSGIVFAPYGNVKEVADTLYFPVSEGIISGGKAVYTTTGNAVCLSLNPFTGRMEYEPEYKPEYEE